MDCGPVASSDAAPTLRRRGPAAVALVWLLALFTPALAGTDKSTTRLMSRCAALAHANTRQSPRGLRIVGAVIEDSTATTPDAGEGRGRQDFCRVRGIIEQEIGFELWLPAPERWNGRFMGVGVGGEAGTLNPRDMARALGRGYAAASTDTGHRVEDANWAWRRPDRRANFAARANHLLATESKALIRRFYAAAPVHSYFVGCSGGGREGLKEAQSYPGDYDGILAGSAGPDQLAASMRLLWMQYVMEPTHPGLMQPSDWELVAARTVAACDRIDGIADGVIEDPRACHFDIASLRCVAGSTTDCLSDGQADYAKAIHAPLRDAQGVAIDQGLAPGVRMRFEPRSAFALTLYGKVVHENPSWDPTTVDIARDLVAARRAWPDLPNDNPDLRPFLSRGGRMIYYHGWSDPFLPALSALVYYGHVQQLLGAKTDDVLRIFMVPGLGHCNGGTGPDQFGGLGQGRPGTTADDDMLSALEAWVEHGRPPERIVAASVVDSKVVRTRPLCPFPQVAAYDGASSPDAAASFVCRVPRQ